MQAKTSPSIVDGKIPLGRINHGPVTAVLLAHESLTSKLARSAARRFPSVDPEDLHQTARIAAWQAIEAFNPDRNIPLEHFLSVCVKNALLKFALANCDPVSRVRLEEDRLAALAQPDGAQPEVGQGTKGIEGHFLGNPSSGAAYQRCLMLEIAEHVARLRPQLQHVYFHHVIAGMSQSELAEALGVTQQRIASLKSELLAHLLELAGDTE